MEGPLATLFEVPDREEGSAISEQLTGELAMKEVDISTIGAGSLFAWAGIPPMKLLPAPKRLLLGK